MEIYLFRVSFIRIIENSFIIIVDIVMTEENGVGVEGAALSSPAYIGIMHIYLFW